MEGDNIKNYAGKGAFDAFLNLLSLISLGWMSMALGGVLFQIIEKFFSVKADYVAGFSQAALKFNIASAIIITPIFLLVVCWLHKNYRLDNLNHKSATHRWLTYLMLLASALTIIGRLVYQLFRLLDGDFTLAVILRTVVLLVIAGGIFGYYFYDLKRTDFSKKSSVSKIFFSLIIVIALATIVGSFFLIDSPQKARLLRYDETRVNDLSQLAGMIDNDYYQTKSLPQDLSAAKYGGINDPVSAQNYEYKIVGPDAYQLCADFALPAPDSGERFASPYADDWYYHAAGYQCFNHRIDLGAEKKLID